MRKKTSAILFEDAQIATQFALKYYEDYVNTLTYKEKTLIGSIQASGLVVGDGREDNIDAINKCFSECPAVPYDIIAWRAGNMRYTNRPFLSGSLLKSTAMRYCNAKHDMHKIIVKKGTKIFPLRALSKDYGDEEAEIILLSDCLHWSPLVYRYY